MAIVLGTEKQVASSFFNDIVVANLTSTTAILAYYDNTATGNFTAVHMTLSAGVITLGTPVNTSSIDGSFLRGCRLSSTAAIFYGDTGGAGRAVVVTVSGTTLTINTVKSLTDSGITFLDIAMLTSTKAIITHTTGGNGVSRILTISGTTITENAAFTYDAGARHNKLSVLTTTKAVVTYSDSANSFRPSGQVLDISGSTITGNTVYQLTTDAVGNTANILASVALSSTKYIYIFDSTASGDMEGQIVDEAATVLTPGALQAIDSVNPVGWQEIVQLSATSAMAAARISSSDDVELYSLTISGTTITIDDTATITVSDGTDIGLGALDATTTIVSYQDDTTELIYAISAVISSGTHIWFSTDGAATFTDIGDSAWAANVVGGVVVVPGTAYQTIFAAVGTSLYKTINGGTAWTLETAVGYEVDFLDLEKDNATVILKKRDTAGAIRSQLWDGAVLSDISTGNFATGGSTAGGDVV